MMQSNFLFTLLLACLLLSSHSLAQVSLAFVSKMEQLVDTGEWPTAIENGNEELARLRSDSVSQMLLMADIHYQISRAHYNLGQYESARRHIHSARQIFETKGLLLKVADCINFIGDIEWYATSVEAALPYYEQAISKYESSLQAPHPGAGTLYEDRAYVYIEMGRFEGARKDLDKALKLNLQYFGREHLKVFSVYIALGNFHKQRNDLYQAQAAFQQALDIGHLIYSSPTPNMGIAYAGLGVALFNLGDYYRGVDHLIQARSILSQYLPMQHPVLLEIHNALCKGYGQMGECDKAKAYCAFVYEHAEKNSLPQAFALEAEGLCQFRLKQEDQADSLLRRGAFLMENQGNIQENALHLGRLYNALAAVQVRKSSWSAARQILDSANYVLAAFMQENPIYIARQQIIEASILEGQGKFQLAREIYQEVLKASGFRNDAFESVLDPQIFEMGLRNYALNFLESYERSGVEEELLKAYEQLKLLAAYFDFLQLQYRREKTRLAFQDYTFDVYVQLVQTAHQLFQKYQDQQYLREAYHYAEKSKNQRILEQWRLQLSRLDNSALDRLSQLRKGILYYQDKLNSREAGDWQNLLFALKKREEGMLKQVYEAYQLEEQTPYLTNPISIARIQEDLAPDQSLLHFVVGQASIFVFLVQAQEIALFDLSHDFPLEEWVQRLRTTIQLPFPERVRSRDGILEEATIEYAKLAHQLYKKLLEPVQDYLTNSLIIIPDGNLGYLPFEVLLKAPPARLNRFKQYPYLLLEHEVSYAYSATLWKEMTLREPDANPEKKILAVAPFSHSEQQLPQTAPLGIDRSSLVEILDSLPYSKEEVLSLKEYFDAAILLDTQATLQNFLQMAQEYNILHLATHARVKEPNDYSYISFYASENLLAKAYLEIRNLYTLQLPADLVVLSACETAIGELYRGEGIMSLARAFSYAGARSILTTLWRVNDKQTSKIILSFYENLDKGLSKDAALTKAKRDYIKQAVGEMGHPFYWSAFILMGDMQPLSILKEKK